MIGLIPKLNIKYTLFEVFRSRIHLFRNELKTDENVFYMNHARTGLRLALSALNLPTNAKVGVTAFNCYTVMHAVKSAGYTIEFIDVKEDFLIDFDDLQQKQGKISALIITHLFGHVNDVERIKCICPNIPIIEDCAHAYLASSEKGAAGCFGDVSIFSIGQGKFPSVGDGGYLVVNNQELKPDILSQFAKLPSNPMYKNVFSVFKCVVLSVLHHPVLYKYFTKPILKERFNSNIDISKYENKESLMLRVNYALLMYKRDFVINYLNRQKENYKSISNTMHKSISHKSGITWTDNPNSNGFIFPLLVDNRDVFISHFIQHGIEVGSHFSKSIDWALCFGYTMGKCPKVEQMVTKIVVIPCHYNLKKKDVKLINNIILQYE